MGGRGVAVGSVGSVAVGVLGGGRCAGFEGLWWLRSRYWRCFFVEEIFKLDELLVLARGLTNIVRILRDLISSERTKLSIPEVRGQTEKN